MEIRSHACIHAFVEGASPMDPGILPSFFEAGIGRDRWQIGLGMMPFRCGGESSVSASVDVMVELCPAAAGG